MSQNREPIAVSLAKFQTDGTINDIPLYKFRLDAKNGLLVWPKNLPKGYHMHYYLDLKTGKKKAHLKDESTGKRIQYAPSFRQLQNSLIERFIKA